MKIGEILKHDFVRPIEEIVKVNNVDEETVRTELTEYIATPSIRQHYQRLFKAFADAPSAPTEAAGVWISGFFGSGKSSFAKNLGYVLANQAVGGTTASALFTRQVDDSQITHLIELVNRGIPCHVFMFDVQTDLSIQTNEEQIALVMYRELLRSLGYAEDYDLAELEIELEGEGKLDAFVAACQTRFNLEWSRVRKGAQKFSRASALLHHLEPATYPNEGSWLQVQVARPLHRISVGQVVERCFDLCARRRPGKAFVFIIDEVGQYVATSSEKLESLRAVVEQFGRVGMERLKRRQIPGPAWVVVTSQEKLQDVYNYMASSQINLPKLQDRFKYQIDLSPADIRQVATHRVLRKNNNGKTALSALFRTHQGTLAQSCRLERTARGSSCTEEEFVQFYPYLPHYIDLSIDVMTGIRLQPGSPKHLGGSNRTIIKQCYEMLMGPRTQLAEHPVGELVTLDKIYELVEGNLPSERQKDIADIAQRLNGDADYPGLASRVGKALCLLEFVRDLPRTPNNIAALLVEHVGDASPQAAVTAVLQKMEAAQFIRASDEGWKLQTAQEKNWEEERRANAMVNRNQRATILDRALKTAIESAKAGSYNYRDLRTFSLSFDFDGRSLIQTKGTAIPVELMTVEPDADFPKRQQQVVTESLQDDRHNQLLWLFPLSAEIEALIAQVRASEWMIQKYQSQIAQQNISDKEKSLLGEERTRQAKLESNLARGLAYGMMAGVGVFRGGHHQAGDLGADFAAMIRGLCDLAVPAMFPKAEMGCRPVGAAEAETFLKQAQLAHLSALYYDGAKGLRLVAREGNDFVANPHAPVATEILDYLKAEDAYGNKVTGGQVVEHFSGWGYGWDPEVIRLVAAVLFRAGVIEITHQSRRYSDYQEPQARSAFASNPAFRSAGLTPREAVGLKALADAARNLEAMLGRHVDMDAAVLKREFQQAAAEDMKEIQPALAKAEARHLPVVDGLREWRDSIDLALASSADDCVRMLAGQGKSLRQQRERSHQVCQALTDVNLETIENAEIALRQELPALLANGGHESTTAAGEELRELLCSPSLLLEINRVDEIAKAVDDEYRRAWDQARLRRAEAYGEAIHAIQAMPEFQALDASMQQVEIEPLLRRSANGPPLGRFRVFDPHVAGGLPALLEDLNLLPTLRAGTESRIKNRQPPPPQAGDGEAAIETLRLSDFFPLAAPLDTLSDADIDAALERLKEKLYSLRELKRPILWQ